MSESKALESLRLVKFTGTSAFDDWTRFKKKLTWAIDSLPKSASDTRKIGLLMSHAGDEAIDIYETLGLTDASKFTEVLAAFDAYVTQKTNTVFERHQ